MRRLIFVYAHLTADISRTGICEVMLDEPSLKAFVYAVKNQYWYQMYIDNLPIWGEWPFSTVI